MKIKILREIEVVVIDSVFLYPENPREMDKTHFEIRLVDKRKRGKVGV